METAYEAMYIIEANQPEEQTTGTIDKYSGVVTRGGGVIDDIDRMDTRRLAYEIKGRREGLYIIMNFRSEPAAKDELERIFHISDDVLRHMIIKQDPKADRFPSKARAADQERREREMAARMANAPAPAAPPAAPAVDTAVTDLAAAPTGDAGADAADATAAATPPPAVPAETTATAVDDPTAADAPAQTDEDTAQGEATENATETTENATETTA